MLSIVVVGLESDAEPPSIESRTQPPSFNQPITNTLVVEGSTARFEARFSGVPPPEIKWLRNGLQVIQNSKNYQVMFVVGITAYHGGVESISVYIDGQF